MGVLLFLFSGFKRSFEKFVKGFFGFCFPFGGALKREEIGSGKRGFEKKRWVCAVKHKGLVKVGFVLFHFVSCFSLVI